MHWQSCLSVSAVPGLDHVVLHITPDSVLRTKQGAQFDVRMLVQEIRGVSIRMIDRRLIANQPNTCASQCGISVFK
jgi:hypothetical protein